MSKASRCPWDCSDGWILGPGEPRRCPCWQTLCRRADKDLCPPEEVRLEVLTETGERWRVAAYFTAEVLTQAVLHGPELVEWQFRPHLGEAPALNWATAQVIVGEALAAAVDPEAVLERLRP